MTPVDTSNRPEEIKYLRRGVALVSPINWRKGFPLAKFTLLLIPFHLPKAHPSPGLVVKLEIAVNVTFSLMNIHLIGIELIKVNQVSETEPPT